MEFAEYLRFVLALGFVLSLIGLLAWIAKKMGWADDTITVRGKTKRLKVVESLTLDQRRKLVIVRRDGVEHLLVLGASNETVIEADIDPNTIPLDEISSPEARDSQLFSGLKQRIEVGMNAPLPKVSGGER
jgi:flagellar protein FliO/FliZ